ncbi:DUF397 domain-containing protein [Streptomyces sp. NPDC098789]|uniref:DUF397 domain-containing protein n=1 Tax=Streptomyces sp. NPDC098789 TaxID=3366098 RepID=UPI0037FE4C5E
MTSLRNSSAHGLAWTKSTYSSDGGNCLEVASGQLIGAVPVRDSKNPTGPALVVTGAQWTAFVNAVKGGQL